MPAFAYIWKCLLLHNSTANICLYSTTSPCPLPMKRLTSITKSAKLNGQLLLKESRDYFVQSAFVSLNAKKWVATDVVANRLTRLDFKKIMDYHQSHKAGFGAISILEISAKNSHAYQKLPSSVQEEAEEEKTLARAIQLKLQGQWTKWCTLLKWICVGNLFCRALFLYSNLFYHHTQFQILTVTLLSNLSKLG